MGELAERTGPRLAEKIIISKKERPYQIDWYGRISFCQFFRISLCRTKHKLLSSGTFKFDLHKAVISHRTHIGNDTFSEVLVFHAVANIPFRKVLRNRVLPDLPYGTYRFSPFTRRITAAVP